MDIKLARIPGRDFTHYIPAEEAAGELTEECFKEAEGEKRYSCSPATVIECDGERTDVRALACLAYRGRFFSVTIRCEKKNTWGGEGEYFEWVKTKLKEYADRKYKGPDQKPPPQAIELKDFLGYWPRGYKRYSEVVVEGPPAGAVVEVKETSDVQASPPRADERREEIFLNDIYHLCRTLDKELFVEAGPGSEEQAEGAEKAETGKAANGLLPGEADMASHPGGLIVVTGATNSSKSLITRGLIFLIMERAARQARSAEARRPHLVTFEDPIEKYYVKNPAGAQAEPEQLTLGDLERLLDALYLDYTPRERGPDADSLKHIIADALRQTPTLLFVGETREREDWKELLQFANTGHLVITTSHAKSVVEAMSDIFRDTKTKTQAQRSEIARRILGVVNVRRFTPKGSRLRALLPALWKSTPKSTANLVADGLASILPAQGREAEIGYYGRKYFAKLLTEESRLTKEVKEMIKGMVKTDQAAWEKKRAEIMKTANEWDFEGV
jgi:Tfp pilus assembly pilus retraction ATPase PilT